MWNLGAPSLAIDVKYNEAYRLTRKSGDKNQAIMVNIMSHSSPSSDRSSDRDSNNNTNNAKDGVQYPSENVLTYAPDTQLAMDARSASSGSEDETGDNDVPGRSNQAPMAFDPIVSDNINENEMKDHALPNNDGLNVFADNYLYGDCADAEGQTGETYDDFSREDTLSNTTTKEGMTTIGTTAAKFGANYNHD